MEHDLSPQEIHKMYLAHDKLVPFEGDTDEARECLNRFIAEGYQPIAGILASKNTTVRYALTLLEKADLYMKEGCLIGPYFIEDQLMPAIRLFRPAQKDNIEE